MVRIVETKGYAWAWIGENGALAQGDDRELITKELNTIIRSYVPKSRVLDIGCGWGDAAVPILKRGCDYFGVDANPLLVQKTQQIIQHSFDIGNVSKGACAAVSQGVLPNLCFSSGFSQYAIASMILHYLNETEVCATFRGLHKISELVDIIAFSDEGNNFVRKHFDMHRVNPDGSLSGNAVLPNGSRIPTEGFYQHSPGGLRRLVSESHVFCGETQVGNLFVHQRYARKL